MELPAQSAAAFIELPSAFLLAVVGLLGEAGVKSCRATCRALCSLASPQLKTARIAKLLALPSSNVDLGHLPGLTALDFRFGCDSHLPEVLALLHKHRELAAARSLRLSGRAGLHAALSTFHKACSGVQTLFVNSQHKFKCTKKECNELTASLEVIEGWTDLRSLTLSHIPLSEAQLAHIASSLSQLRSLSVKGLCNSLACSSLSHALEPLTALTSLVIDKIRLTAGSTFHPRQAATLRSVELSSASLSADAFAALNSLTRLESLYLWGTGHRSALAFAPLHLSCLRRLHLELPLTNEVLAGLAGCPVLTSLSMTCACIAAPCPTPLASVKRLSLQMVLDGDDGIESGGDGDGSCAPLALWCPCVTSLSVESGGGEALWALCRDHPMLTSLRAEEDALPPPVGSITVAISAAPTISAASSGDGEAAAAAAAGNGSAGAGSAAMASAGPAPASAVAYGAGSTNAGSPPAAAAALLDGAGTAATITAAAAAGSTPAAAAAAGLAAAVAAMGVGEELPPLARSKYSLRHLHGLDEPSCSAAGGAGRGAHHHHHGPLGPGGASAALLMHDEDVASDCTASTSASLSSTSDGGGGNEGDRAHAMPYHGPHPHHPHPPHAHHHPPAEPAAGQPATGEQRAPLLLPPHLASLQLDSCSDFYESQFLQLASLSRLTSLCLSGCQGLSDTALTSIARSCPGIRDLQLGYAEHLTDAGLQAMAAALPRLESLLLQHCPGVTAAGVGAVAEGARSLRSARVQSCQGVAREAAIAIPQVVGRPLLSVICTHPGSYDML